MKEMDVKRMFSESGFWCGLQRRVGWLDDGAEAIEPGELYTPILSSVFVMACDKKLLDHMDPTGCQSPFKDPVSRIPSSPRRLWLFVRVKRGGLAVKSGLTRVNVSGVVIAGFSMWLERQTLPQDHVVMTSITVPADIQ